MPPEASQQHLRWLFELWGLPCRLRLDNGVPWATPGMRTPSVLILWLIGLGIVPLFGRPRQSTDNAVVERSHGVLNAWVEPATCPNLTVLQARLDEFVYLQRTRYPRADGRSRLEHYPDLLRISAYRCEDEAQSWEVQRVVQYVARSRYTRMVEKNGRITLFTHEYSVGRAYAAQQVTAALDADTTEWVIEDRRGDVLKRFPANQFDYSTLSQLALRYR